MIRELLRTLVVALLYDLNAYAIGTLRPASELAILSSVTNLSELADYTFTFFPNTTIPSGGLVKVSFPQQFATDLGFKTGAPTCGTNTCTRSGRDVTVTIGSDWIANSSGSVMVGGVTNPSLAGGTGPFAVATYKGVNVLDVNLAFGVIGVAETIVKMTSASVRITTGESAGVGDSSRVDFFFRSEVGVKPGNWLRFTFPTTNPFQLVQIPTCAPVSVKGLSLQGVLSCTLINGKVFLTGIDTGVSAGTDMSIRISVTNPMRSGITGTFVVETGLANTNTVLERISSIPGIVITPGQVTGISLLPEDVRAILSTSRELPYILKFTLTNPIELGGKIKVMFNSDFKPNTVTTTPFPDYSYVVSGLADASAGVTLDYDSTTFILTVRGFAAYTKQEITLWVLLKNPTYAGLTRPLAIYSVASDIAETVIDQNSITATTTILTTSSPTLSNASGTLQANSVVTLIISITPNKPVPALGYVAIRFPDSFSIPTPLPTCLLTPNNIGETNAAACSYANGIITAQLFATTLVVNAGPGDFVAAVASLVKVAASTNLKSPKIAGTFFLDVSTYDTSKVLLETGTCSVKISPASVALTVKTPHKLTNKFTIVMWIFTLSIDLPSGVAGQSPQGFIDFSFETSTAFAAYLNNLGLAGSVVSNPVPCAGIQGITAPTGSALRCVFSTIAAVSGAFTVVTVSNFSAMTAGTTIELHFSGILSARATNTNYKITTYQLANRLTAGLNSGTFIDAAATQISTTPASTLTLATPPEVSSPFSFSFQYSVAATINLPVQFLMQIIPTHDNGYCANTDSSKLACAMSTAGTSCSPLCYASSDAILMTITGVNIPAASLTITISNLMSPASVRTNNDRVLVISISNGTAKDWVYNTSYLSSVSGKLTTFSVTPSNPGGGYINVIYAIAFIPAHAVPLLGTVQITFPAIYTLNTSVPNITWKVAGAPATSGGITCAITASTVTLGGFTGLSNTAAVTLTLYGVKNPPATGSAGTFSISTKNGSGDIIDTGSYSGVTLTSLFVPAATTPTVTMFPTNAGVNAIYEVQLTPANQLGVGGSIDVIFPSQFGVIPKSAACIATSPFTTYTSCTLTGSTFTVTLDTAYDSSSSLTLQFLNVPNFAAGVSSAFLISTKYDSVVLDQSPSNSATPVVTTTAMAAAMSVSKIVASPGNEGERADYTIYMTPLVAFTDRDFIVVTFPIEYDPALGSKLTCWAAGLIGSLVCTVTSSRVVTVTGYRSFTPCGSCTIALTIRGIVNPPSTTATGYITVGTLSGSRYLEYQSAAASLAILSAPTLLSLPSYSFSTTYARYLNDMLFNLTVRVALPAVTDQGTLRIVYPPQYLLDNSAIACNSSSNWASGSPNCTLVDDYMRVTGGNSSFTGSLVMTLGTVPNPVQQGIAGSIVVKTVDEYNRKVIERTYANLNPSQVNYTYLGPLIVVNGDQPISVRSGTFTSPVYITVDFPMARNLTLTPVLPGFLINPATIKFNVGQLSANFTLGAPVTVTTLTNIMLWTVVNEASPVYYTPLQKTVVIVENSTVISAYIQDVPDIPIGGKSLPFKVWLNRGPVNDITIGLELSSDLNGATLVSPTLEFKSGETEKYGQIIASVGSNSGSGKLTLSTAGTDAGLYTLPRSQITITLVATSTQDPVISTVSVLEYTKSTAKVSISTNSAGTIYYMYALKGTAIPPFDEVSHFGPPPYDRTRSKYGSLYITSTHFGTVKLTDLQAQRDYTLYAYFVDLMDKQAATCSMVSFQTKAMNLAARTSLRFSQAFMNDFEVSQIKSVIGLLLALESWQINSESVTYAAVNSTTTGRRLAQMDTLYTILTLVIVDNPFNDNYATPLGLVSRLASQATQLSARLNNFDKTYTIQGTVAVYAGCEFQSAPVLRSTAHGDQMVGFSAVLKSPGVIYAATVLTPITVGSPLPWQVAEGLNSENVPVPAMSKVVSGSEQWNSTFENLLPNSNYVLYLTCGNAHPTFADLPAAARMVGLGVKTDKTPNPKILGINSSLMLVPLALLLLISPLF